MDAYFIDKDFSFPAHVNLLVHIDQQIEGVQFVPIKTHRLNRLISV